MTGKSISPDWEKFNNQSCLEDFEKINWNHVLQLNKNNVKITFKNYLNTVNTLINSHAPLKKLNKKQRKFQQKPWITKGIQNAIEKKNRLFKKYIKCGDSNKNIFHQYYKTYQNSLSTFGLNQLMNKPTRSTLKTSSLIDHILTNLKESVTQIIRP